MQGMSKMAPELTRDGLPELEDLCIYGCPRLTPICARGLRERSPGFALRRINHAGCYKLTDDRFQRVLFACVPDVIVYNNPNEFS